MNILHVKNFSVCKPANLCTSKLVNTRNYFVPSFGSGLEADCFEKETPQSKKTKYGTINYLKNENFCDLEFDKPLNLKEALKKIKGLQEDYKIYRYGLCTYGYIFKSFDEAFSLRFKEMKFTKFLGAGNNALALENEDGQVLKLSERDTFVFRDGPEDFDARIFKKGNVGKNYFYYLQEKCSQEGITPEHVEQIEKRIAKKGYKPFDMSEMQIGFDKNGKVCLIDPECARDTKKYEEALLQNALWMREHGIDIDYI